MNNKKYKILDVSNWEIIRKGKGYSTSYWLVDPKTRKKALFKRPKYNEDYDCYYGDHWAEKIVSEIGKFLDFDMPEIDLAIFKQKQGCISYNFLNRDESLREGIDLMSVDVTKDNRRNYILDNILKDLKEYRLIDDFINLLLFDAFIGQPDRHEENWGIIISKEGNSDCRLSPIYDNASSLGRNLLPNKISKMFKDDNCFNSYIEGCQSCIKLEKDKELSQLDMLYYLSNHYNELYLEFASKLDDLDSNILIRVINKVSNEFMEENHKKLVTKILLERRRRLISILNKEGGD